MGYYTVHLKNGSALTTFILKMAIWSEFSFLRDQRIHSWTEDIHSFQIQATTDWNIVNESIIKFRLILIITTILPTQRYNSTESHVFLLGDTFMLGKLTLYSLLSSSQTVSSRLSWTSSWLASLLRMVTLVWKCVWLQPGPRSSSWPQGECLNFYHNWFFSCTTTEAESWL